MDLQKLIELHNDAIGAMNGAHEAVRYLESALIKARESAAAAVKNEQSIAALMRDAARSK